MPTSRRRLRALVILGMLAGCAGAVRGDDRAVGEEWTHWRGSTQQAGRASGTLPDQPKIKWRLTSAEAFSGSPVIAGGRVYVGGEDGILYAVDLETGKPVWKCDKPDLMQSSPTVCGDTVYVGDDSGRMHAVRASDGTHLWEYPTDGQVISAVSCGGGLLVFGSYDGFVYALRPDGKPAWKFETAGRVHGTPAIVDNLVVAAGCDEMLHVINLADGKSVRQVPMGSVSGASAAVRGDRVFVGTYGNQVLGIDYKQGKTAWRFEDPERQFPFMSSAALTTGLAIVGGRDKYVHALRLSDGAEVWSFRTKGRVDSSPVVVDDRVFVPSGDGIIYALTAEDGKEVWRYESGSAFSGSPAVADGVLVIGSLDGVLYAFGQ